MPSCAGRSTASLSGAPVEARGIQMLSSASIRPCTVCERLRDIRRAFRVVEDTAISIRTFDEM